MFSCNKRISEKQLRRMIVLSVFASCIFVLPYLSAGLFGESVCSGLLVFFIMACIYATCIYGIGKKYYPTGFVYAAQNGGLAGKVLLFIQILRLLLRLVFYIVLSVAVLGEAQVPFMEGGDTDSVGNLLVILPLLLVALYGANRGIEKQGRLYEMIFWVLFIPFIIVILFGLKEVDYSIFVPHISMPLGRLLLYSYTLLAFVLPVENYLYLRPYLGEHSIVVEKKKTQDSGEEEYRFHKKKSNVWMSYGALLFVIALAVVITLFILGIFGVHGAAGEEMVTIAIMRYIRLPFGVLERFDMLMIWFFMTGCFILICSTLYYLGHLLRILCGRIKRIWLLLAMLVLAVGIVVFLPGYSHTLMLFRHYGAVIDIPLSILMPVLGIGLAETHLVKEQEGGQP